MADIMCVCFHCADECTHGTHICDEVCINTDGSYTCGCHNSGYSLQSDGHSCACGGQLTTASGSFQTPGWPTSYPTENFECEWIIDVPNSGTIEFTIDETAFGIKGRSPCPSDHIEFFDGITSNAVSLNKICGIVDYYLSGLPIIITTSSVARVVFTGSDLSRGSKRVGIKVDYTTICMYIFLLLCVYNYVLCSLYIDVDCSTDNGGCDHICIELTSSIECQCRDGYNLVGRSTCTGMLDILCLDY